MAPSLGRRFSGINATMETLLPVMRRSLPIACCGTHLSEAMPRTTLRRWLFSRSRKQWRIWHARRNNDMLLGLFLRHVLRQKLILLWTSAAQRRHTWLTRFCYHRMDAVIATTAKAAGFLDCPSEVSHHGIDATTYTPPKDHSQVRKDLGLADRPTLGVFGRIRPQKGTGDLVEALLTVLPKHPEWQVVFVGAVTEQFHLYQADLKKKLAEAGLADRVHFTGFLKNFSDLPQWYQACDIVGCVSRVEGFGVTCLEGMASGSPVLATEAGAWADIITEGHDGWLAKTQNPESLRGALDLALSKTADELDSMGKAARATILDRFTVQHEVERIANTYVRLFEQYGQPLRIEEEGRSDATKAAA